MAWIHICHIKANLSQGSSPTPTLCILDTSPPRNLPPPQLMCTFLGVQVPRNFFDAAGVDFVGVFADSWLQERGSVRACVCFTGPSRMQTLMELVV